MICIQRIEAASTEVHEHFVANIPVERTAAENFVELIKDSLAQIYLNISDRRGQCYEGASKILRKVRGVATLIRSLNYKSLL